MNVAITALLAFLGQLGIFILDGLSGKRRRKKEAKDAIKKGLEDEDPGAVLRGFNNLK